jgi:hypothetical protein
VTVRLPPVIGEFVPVPPGALPSLQPELPDVQEPTQEPHLSPETPVVVKLPPAHEPTATATVPLNLDLNLNNQQQTEDSATVANLNLQAEIEFLKSQQASVAQKERQLEEEFKRLELGSRRVDSTALPASENGSASSSYIPSNRYLPQQQQQQVQPSFIPPGIAMAENGSFFEIATGQPVVFVASSSPAPQSGYMGAPYPPPHMTHHQPYYPNAQPGPFYAHHHHQPPHIPHRDSYGTFTPPPYGRDSPLGIPQNSVPPGYFAPPRPSGKIQIRAPTSHEVAILKNPNKLAHDQPHEMHEQADGQVYSVDNPYAYQNGSPMPGQPYYPTMRTPRGYLPSQIGYDYGYGQY